MIGVVGHRSWIAEHLMAAVPDSAPVSKQSIIDNTAVLDDIDCLYVFPGRARPNAEETLREMELVEALTNLTSRPKRIVFISSMASYFTEYGKLKSWNEKTLDAARRRMPLLHIIRAPAVFGPGQPVGSPMLVPSLAREGHDLELRNGLHLARFISVFALVEHLKKFADPKYWDVNQSGDPDSMFEIPGAFSATSEQIRDLWRTWDHYASLRRER